MVSKRSQYHLLREFVDSKLSAQILRHLESSHDLSEKDQLEIHQGNMKEGLVNVLKEIYPVCSSMVGERFFAIMASHYIERTPPLFSQLFNYGDCFPIFVSEFEPTHFVPYLPDMCCLEWAWHCAKYSEDNSGLSHELLSGFDRNENHSRFNLPSDSTMIATTFPIYRIWQMYQPGAPDTGDEVIYLNECDERLLVWRKGLEVTIDRLCKNEWVFLEAISDKKSMKDIHALLAEEDETVNVDELLNYVIDRGWVSGQKLLS